MKMIYHIRIISQYYELFDDHYVIGISADRIRWNQCVELVNKKMGMAVGSLFIRDNFDPKSKETALEMIHNIRNAFNELLQINEWMDKETKKTAEEKANAINERIGYPELLTNSIELSKEYQSVSKLYSTHRKLIISIAFNTVLNEMHENSIIHRLNSR